VLMSFNDGLPRWGVCDVTAGDRETPMDHIEKVGLRTAIDARAQSHQPQEPGPRAECERDHVAGSRQ
jgi:hypothetical protein